MDRTIGIAECIYKSCDQKNENLVPVSNLVDFIKPYMPNNLAELVELQARLDPHNMNPCIGCTFFETVMRDWISEIQANDVNNSLSDFPVNFSSDASQLSCDTKTTNNNNTMNDNLEEQICKLKHCLNKTTAELELVKQQLAGCEDLNEALQAEVEGLHQLHHREQPNLFYNASGNETAEEEEKEMRKSEQLAKILSINEKEQQMQLEQINQLDNENHHLKKKIEILEKARRETKKSITNMRDCIDIKEAEISTLEEITNSLRHELEEKSELVNFYANERELLKHDLKAALQGTCTTQNNFNTPKLLHQLSNPISPLVNVKSFETSSPIKAPSAENGNSSGFDLSEVGVLTLLRSPHKTLKEELFEVSKEDDTVEHLQNIVKDQENIKNILWETVKQLTCDSQELGAYKKDYLDLIGKIQDKGLEIELNVTAKTERMELLRKLTIDLNNVGMNLCQQRLLDADIQKKLTVLSQSLNKKTIITNRTIKYLNNDLKRKEKIINTKKVVLDKSTETSDWVPPVEPKKTNFTRQQMRMERLQEKQEKIERDLAHERGINTKLSLKCQEITSENEKLKKSREKSEKNLDAIKGENASLSSEIRRVMDDKDSLEKENEKNLDAMKGENASLSSEIRRLLDNKDSLEKENDKFKESLSDALNRLAIETTLCGSLCRENDVFRNKQYQMELKIKEDVVLQASLKKRLSDLRMFHNLGVGQLQSELEERREEIGSLKRQVEGMEVEECNGKLRRAILDTIDLLKLYDDATNEDLLNRVHLVNEEKEIDILISNVELITLLLQNLSDKYLYVMKHVENEDERFQAQWNDISVDDDDSFKTCASDLSYSQDMLNMMPLVSDSFLENFELEGVDLRHLSRKEVEEKFTTLALMLTVDVTTAEKRFIVKEEKFAQLYLKFFSYLNSSVDLMARFSDRFEKSKFHKTVLTYLQLLKDISEDLLKTAVERGVVHYEQRTANCWKLVINYIALLSQENKQMKEVGETYKKEMDLQLSKGQDERVVTGSPLVSPNYLRHRCGIEEKRGTKGNKLNFPWGSNNDVASNSFFLKSTLFRKLKFFIYMLFLALVIFVITLVFYVEQLCPKNGKRTCPLQWIINLFIEKTYSDNFHL